MALAEQLPDGAHVCSSEEGCAQFVAILCNSASQEVYNAKLGSQALGSRRIGLAGRTMEIKTASSPRDLFDSKRSKPQRLLRQLFRQESGADTEMSRSKELPREQFSVQKNSTVQRRASSPLHVLPERFKRWMSSLKLKLRSSTHLKKLILHHGRLEGKPHFKE
jgi:hypothetical protein